MVWRGRVARRKRKSHETFKWVRRSCSKSRSRKLCPRDMTRKLLFSSLNFDIKRPAETSITHASVSQYLNNVSITAVLSRMNRHLAEIDVAVIAFLFVERIRNQSQSRHDDVTFILYASSMFRRYIR